jgi:hypothetical protein
MKTRRQYRPEPECLEDKALLSTLAHPLHAHPSQVASIVVAHPATQTSLLQGTVTGTYVLRQPATSTVANVSVNGSGTAGSLGTVRLSGVVHIGLANAGKGSQGNLVLSNDRGTIQFALKGKGGSQPLLPASPSTSTIPLRYTVVKGTGAYRKFHGGGSITLAMTPQYWSMSASTRASGESTSIGRLGMLPPSQLPPASGAGRASAAGGSSGQAGELSHGMPASAVKVGAPPPPTIILGHFTLVFNGSPSMASTA